MAILRKPETRAQLGYRSDTSVSKDVREGLLTNPVRVGVRTVGWPDDEIRAIVAARIAGKGKDEIRALVQQLQDQRAAKFERLINGPAPEPASFGRVVEMRKGC